MRWERRVCDAPPSPIHASTHNIHIPQNTRQDNKAPAIIIIIKRKLKIKITLVQRQTRLVQRNARDSILNIHS